MDELLKLVVPAVFLIVWALGQLMNREQPKPRPRPIPRGGGLPPRPDMPPRPRERGPVPQPTMRWGDDGPERPEPERPTPEPRRTPAEPEEIVILGTDVGPPRPSPIRPAARGSSRPRPDPNPRRPRRGARPARPQPAPEPSRNLATIGGLTATIQHLMAPDERPPLIGSTPVAQAPPPLERTAAPSTEGVRRALMAPERVREALVINELLGPPVALRGPRRR